MNVVVDTNVLVSGLMRADSPPGRIVDLLRSGIITLVIDDRIFAEYEDVLRRKYFARYFKPVDVDYILDFICHESHRTVCSHYNLTIPDAGDIPFLETALTEKVPLITGNIRHFPPLPRHKCIIVSPASFLDSFN